MGCVNVKLSDEVRATPLFPPKRELTNIFWLLVFVCVVIATLILVGVCYQSSNWYNIKDIKDYDGAGMVFVTQKAMVYHLNIAVSAGAAIGLSLLMMLLMIWLSSIFMIMALGIVTVYSLVLVAWVWEKYDSNRETIVLVAGILLSFLMVLWFFFFMRMGKKIELIFLLFKIAGTAMWNNMRMMLYGPVVFIFNVIGIALCTYFVCIVTAASMEFEKYNDETLSNNSLINWTYAFIIIMVMWWLHFTQGCLNFLVGYAVGGWYFQVPTVGKELFENSGTLVLFEYHLGTMCFGSFLLTIFWVIREILDMLRQFKLSNTSLAFIGTFAEWLLVCCQACWEMAATNSNYATALYGFGYCSSTRRTIELNLNAESLSIGMVGNALIYMCILMVGLISATLGVTVIEVETISQRIPVSIVLFLVAIGLSWMLLSVYVNITRTIYLCICIDIEKNGINLPTVVDDKIKKYISMVPKFVPPPPPPVQAPPPILPKAEKRYEEDSEEEEEEEEEQMVQVIQV